MKKGIHTSGTPTNQSYSYNNIISPICLKITRNSGRKGNGQTYRWTKLTACWLTFTIGWCVWEAHYITHFFGKAAIFHNKMFFKKESIPWTTHNAPDQPVNSYLKIHSAVFQLSIIKGMIHSISVSQTKHLIQLTWVLRNLLQTFSGSKRKLHSLNYHQNTLWN